MIRSSIDIQELSKQYKRKKFVIIDNFLERSFANGVFRSLEEISEKSLWRRVILGDPRHYDRNTRCINDPRYASYQYDTLPLNPPTESKHLNRRRGYAKLGASNPMLKVGKFLNSSKGQNLISQITGNQLKPKSASISATRYMPGDYNGAHMDTGATGLGYGRKVTFVLNMTKNWIVNWGGEFAVLDEKQEQILKSFVPTFNRLMIFDVFSLSHAVMPVSLYAQLPRYTLTGWFH